MGRRVSEEAWSVRVDDFRGCSFEHFVTYAFDRPVRRDPSDPHWWDDEAVDEVELLVDRQLQFQHATALFRDPLVLHARFSREQIDQGFWFLAFGNATDYGAFFVEALWDPDVDVGVRCQCVAAMFDLYEKLFSPLPTDTATHMWWDLIATFVLEHGDVVAGVGPSGELCSNRCAVYADVAICYAGEELVQVSRLPATGVIAQPCSW